MDLRPDDRVVRLDRPACNAYMSEHRMNLETMDDW